MKIKNKQETENKISNFSPNISIITLSVNGVNIPIIKTEIDTMD